MAWASVALASSTAPAYLPCLRSIPPRKLKKMQTPISDSSPPRKLDGMVLRDHRFQLPLVYSDPEGEKLEIFAREVCLRESDADKTLPWAIYFQGGPGCASPRPTLNSGWISETPLSPALRSGPTTAPGASLQKQIPSSCRALDDMPFLGSQTKFLTAKEEGFVK